MASSSSMAFPSSSSSSFVSRWNHDVFLSFRGEDTRNNFISHLHHALIQKGIDAFIDDNLRRGERICPALVEAIEGSRVSIVVFSRNFASSTWCLDEVVKILECRESKGQLVRPVFLLVDPSEMRKGTGIFNSFMTKHEEDFKHDPEKVRRWRIALGEAASLSGWHLRDGVESESEIIKKIVEEVWSKLSRPYFHVATHPVALDHHVESIYTMLLKKFSGGGAAMVGICGVGGIGKTTVAKAVYNLIADQFEGSTFLVNVKETSRQYGLEKLQEALLCDMLGDPSVKVGYSLIGVKLIKEKLRDKRVLLVLDDVDTLGILRDLLGDGDWFGSGSRIIVTARKKEALVDHCVETYQVQHLNYDDALQLFCWNAFQTPSPATDYKLLSFSFMSYVRGIPLFLIVLGSYLKGKSVEEWHRALNTLEELVHKGKGDEALRISFDSLETQERIIFLDIACFFQGDDKDYVVKQLDRCNFYPDRVLAILEDRSLISIESNRIWMHDLVQKMGQEIVREESPSDPSKRSRLWCHEDVLQALKGNSGTSSCIEGIRLDMVEPQDLLRIMKEIKNKKMEKLRVFIARDIQISRCPEYLSKQFRWPDIHGNELPVFVESTTPRFSAFQSYSNESSQSDVHENDLSDTAESWGVEELNLFEESSGQVKTISLNFNPIKVASRRLFSKLRGKWKKHGGIGVELEKDLMRCRRFTVKELYQASNSFSSEIGFGGSGSVYSGCLVDGQQVAIKKFRAASFGGYSNELFVNECRVHFGNNHKNLAKPIGFLAEINDRAIVYEYLCNGSLSDHLHGSRDSKDQAPIMSSWSGRLKVALDVARGIEYLHVYTVPRVIHRDVKSPNILLDVDFTAKLSDFGRAAFLEEKSDSLEDDVFCGTFGYIDPEYATSIMYSTKSDVYGFGVVLLELLSGLKALTRDENETVTHLPILAGKYIKDGDFDKKNILDPKMPEITNPQEMEAVRDVIFLAMDCTRLEGRDRPSMTEVVDLLSRSLKRSHSGGF